MSRRIMHRNEGIINGVLMAAGALMIIDNVLLHWIFEFHRAVPGPDALQIEVALVVIGLVLLGIGIWREITARRRLLLEF